MNLPLPLDVREDATFQPSSSIVNGLLVVPDPYELPPQISV
jgi:hypothetical protein